LVGLPLVLSPNKFDPVVGAVGFDEFDGLPEFSIKVVSGVGMSWSLIVKMCVDFDVFWEIVLLSHEDCCELIAECVCLVGRHGGNSSVF